MPTLDFKEVLDDDAFRDDITVTSTSRVVGSTGEEADSPATPVATKGIVIPGKSSTMRQADGTRVAAYIEVYTQYRITAGYKVDDSNQHSADIVTLANGWTYTVMVVEDYSRFGTGWIKASCDLNTMAPPN